MVTDDEKRLVVKHLKERGIPLFTKASWNALGRALGVDGELNPGTVVTRLVELIDPFNLASTRRVVKIEVGLDALENVVRQAVREAVDVDRARLLSLASSIEAERCPDYGVFDEIVQDIRLACWAEDGGAR